MQQPWIKYVYGREQKEERSENKSMITASEAYNETTRNVETSVYMELSNIEKHIKNAITEGKYSVSFDGKTLNREVKNKLESLGYTVKTGDQYNVPYYIISWN